MLCCESFAILNSTSLSLTSASVYSLCFIFNCMKGGFLVAFLSCVVDHVEHYCATNHYRDRQHFHLQDLTLYLYPLAVALITYSNISYADRSCQVCQSLRLRGNQCWISRARDISRYECMSDQLWVSESLRLWMAVWFSSLCRTIKHCTGNY